MTTPPNPTASPLGSERVGPDLIPPPARALSDGEIAALWEIVVEIGRAWRNVDDDSASLRSTFRELIHVRTSTAPSYVGEYVSAVAVLDELRREHGPDAFRHLFFSVVVPPNRAPETRLEHAKRFVVDELIRMQVLSGGFKSFGAVNYKGYMGGSRFNEHPPVRTGRPEDAGR